MSRTLTFREDVDAELDLGEVAGAQLFAEPIEADAFAERNLFLAVDVVRQHVECFLIK